MPFCPHSYSWLVSDAYSHCSPEAIGGASSETFQWAMSVRGAAAAQLLLCCLA